MNSQIREELGVILSRYNTGELLRGKTLDMIQYIIDKEYRPRMLTSNEKQVILDTFYPHRDRDDNPAVVKTIAKLLTALGLREV